MHHTPLPRKKTLSHWMLSRRASGRISSTAYSPSWSHDQAQALPLGGTGIRDNLHRIPVAAKSTFFGKGRNNSDTRALSGTSSRQRWSWASSAWQTLSRSKRIRMTDTSNGTGYKEVKSYLQHPERKRINRTSLQASKSPELCEA